MCLLATLFHYLNGRTRPLLQGADHVLNVCGRLLSATCNTAHFIGYDSKPASLFPGSRCFNRGIES
jgi:hypothetical protein